MRARILRPEEWKRLPPSVELSQLLPLVEPYNIALSVVEDSDGEIVACQSVFGISMFEGTWIDESHRGNPGVTRALLRQSFAIPQVRGEKWAICGMPNEKMEEYVLRIGGVPLKSKFYVFPTGA